MKAFWMFIRNANTGSGANAPAFPPGVGGQSVTPGDLIRLTGPAVSPHRHLLVGGVALPDDNITGTGAGHRHYVGKFGAGWTQVTVGATAHTHILPTDVNANLMPEYFLTFWAGSDADAATITASPDCFPIVEATITLDEEGNPTFVALDNTAWSAPDLATWQARCLSILGVTLPSQIDRGNRLVMLFLGALLSRQMSNEAAYRFVSGAAVTEAPQFMSAERPGLSGAERAAELALTPTVTLRGREIPAYTTPLGAAIWNAGAALVNRIRGNNGST